MNPQCLDMGVGLIPWSPLARGRLARPADAPGATERGSNDSYANELFDEADTAIIDAVGTVAEHHGVARAKVALAWLLGRPGVSAPVVGATKVRHLEDAADAVSLELTAEDTKLLEAPYRPRPVVGHY